MVGAETSWDALIVGAGPAGAASALALVRLGFRVAVLDAPRTPGPRIGESLAGVALHALAELGLRERFLSQPRRPTYLTRSAWGGAIREKHSIQHRHGPDHHVDRAEFDAWLGREAEAAGATWLRGARLGAVERDGERDGYRVHVVATSAEPAVLRARFLLEASGRAAWLGRKLGAERWRPDRLVGVARFYRAPALEPCIFVESAPTGWWYSAPLPAGEAVAMWITDAGSPDARAVQRADWDRCLSQAPLTHERLRAASELGPAHAYAAGPALTCWDASQPWLPVGDAALAGDPIAGEGLCFALRSALEAASAIALASRSERGVFARYQRGVRAVFEQHLAQRARIYADVRSWPDAPFWSARRTVPARAQPA